MSPFMNTLSYHVGGPRARANDGGNVRGGNITQVCGQFTRSLHNVRIHLSDLSDVDISIGTSERGDVGIKGGESSLLQSSVSFGANDSRDEGIKIQGGVGDIV